MKKKNKKNIWVLLPKKLNEDINNLNLTKTNRNNAIKFVAHIIKENGRDNYDSLKFREKPSSYFRSVYGGRYFAGFLNPLIKNNIIQCNESYTNFSKNTEQNQSKSYRVNNDYFYKNLEYINTNYSTTNHHSLTHINTHIPISFSPISTISCNMLHRFVTLHNRTLRCNFSLSKQCQDMWLSVRKNLQTPVLLHQNCRSNLILRTFEKSTFEDLFDSLTYNYRKMEATVAYVISKINVNSFRIDAQVEGITFEVYDRMKNRSYYVTKDRILNDVKKKGLTLIQDKDKYYIDDLDRYVETKKRNIELSYKTSISALKKRIYSVNRNKTNRRLDSVFTSMCKHTFDIIKVDNDLIEIDLVNSQYAIFANWLMQEDCYKETDVREFCSLAINGGLYEYIVEQLKLDDRKNAKKIMMTIAFSSWKTNSINKVSFKKVFPTVYDFIHAYNKNTKDGFAVELQNKESGIFIDGIMPILLDRGFFFLTKHDSLVIRNEDKEAVVNIVKTYFDLISLKSSIKVDGELIHNGVSECQILDETEKEGICQATEPQEEIGFERQFPKREEPINRKPFCKWTATEAEKQAE
ncbi:MAG: hypothetical protein WC716_06960 [Chitinophagaceae bacterium]|jgi:hypothetical protein